MPNEWGSSRFCSGGDAMFSGRSHVGPCMRQERGPGSFCGGCYANMRGRETCRGHSHSALTHARKVPYKEFFVKRPEATKSPAKGQWICPDTTFQQEYPTLSQGMCDVWWDDGKPREPWTLTLRFDATGVSLCVNDKGLSMGLYTTGEGVDDALALLENALKEGTGQWRRWKK